MNICKRMLATRGQRIVLNILSTLLLQFFTLLCGLVVPRVILGAFGSTVNGVVSSITQFLSYIVLLESGVGGVIKAALYQPLAEKDNQKLSGILWATQNFFRKIALIFIVYMFVLTAIFPIVTTSSFSWGYTGSLILIVGISTAAQYYFGITYHLLLQSDQKLYFTNLLQIVTVVINAVLVVSLTLCGCSIQWVKLGSALIFVMRPLLLNLYVSKNYQLDRNVPPDKLAIRQRWDGLGQHIAFFIHNNTDIVVLSVFANMLEVSVYTVHYAVINGIRTVLSSLSSGFAPAMGDMLAKKEVQTLNKTLNNFEFLCFILVSIFFTITALMIEPFIMLYTKGIADVNYFRPLFAGVLCAAEGVYVIRDIYATVVLSAGHYRQTSRGAYMEAAINIVFSVLLVRSWGLIGVAVGTLIAMSYRTLDYVWYLSKHIMYRPMMLFFKRVLVNLTGILAAASIVLEFVSLDCDTWLMWIATSFVVSLITAFCVLLINFIFYYPDFCCSIRNISKKRKSK